MDSTWQRPPTRRWEVLPLPLSLPRRSRSVTHRVTRATVCAPTAIVNLIRCLPLEMYDGTGSKHNERESPRVRPYLPSVNIIYCYSSRRRGTMCKQRVKSFLKSRSAKLSLDYLSCDDPLQQTSEHLSHQTPSYFMDSWQQKCED